MSKTKKVKKCWCLFAIESLLWQYFSWKASHIYYWFFSFLLNELCYWFTIQLRGASIVLRAEGAELRAVPAALPGRGSRHVSSHARAAPVGELVARLLPAAGREPPAIRDRARARPWRGQCAGLGACVGRGRGRARTSGQPARWKRRPPETGVRWGAPARRGGDTPSVMLLTNPRLWACVLNAVPPSPGCGMRLRWAGCGGRAVLSYSSPPRL